MSNARTKLEGAITNDPEHPAIREFITKVELVLEAANKQANIKGDVAALCVIHLEMTILKRTMFSG